MFQAMAVTYFNSSFLKTYLPVLALTMKVRVPAAAALIPPETGASTKTAPIIALLSANSLLTAGSTVLLSINREPDLLAPRIPSEPV